MKDVTIHVFDPRDMQIKTDEIADYLDDLEEKANRICERLASIGAVTASLGFARVPYNGPKDVAFSVEPLQDGYAIHARGNAVLFLEFGAGAKHGYGHPEPEGYGPGTYPGKGHWDDPRGWWIPKDKGGGHTYGNPPTMAMYETAKALRERVLDVAREVFNG